MVKYHIPLTNFYRRSIRHAAQTQAPLNLFLRDSRKNDKRVIPWNADAETAFTEIKNNIANAALLAHPSTDASDTDMGAALKQRFKYFRHLLEGRAFKIFTDHKPLTYVFAQRMEKAYPRQQRQLSFISQFATVIEHIPGSDNVVADALSRVESIFLPTEIRLNELAEAQKNDQDRVLSTVMLGLRSNVMDCGSSPAEFIYGTTLRIPG